MQNLITGRKTKPKSERNELLGACSNGSVMQNQYKVSNFQSKLGSLTGWSKFPGASGPPYSSDGFFRLTTVVRLYCSDHGRGKRTIMTVCST